VKKAVAVALKRVRWIIFLQKKPYEVISGCEQFIYALKGGDFLLIRLRNGRKTLNGGSN
jgi:hypothetical protein